MNKLFKMCILLLFLMGCQKPVSPDWRGICTTRFLVITKDGFTRWTRTKISKHIDLVNKVYADSGLKFNFLDVEYREDDGLFELGSDDYFRACTESRNRARDRHELLIHLVDKLYYPDGREIGGLAYYPSNMYGSVYAHGVFESSNCYDGTTAHELGHSFNLPHVWEDPFDDTPSIGPDDCDELIKYCNIMSYCAVGFGCDGRYLSKQQICEVGVWAVNYPRIWVVEDLTPKKTIPLRKIKVKYTTSTQPVS